MYRSLRAPSRLAQLGRARQHGFFYTHPLAAELRWIGSVFARVECIDVKIILHQQGPALAYEIKQALIILAHIFAGIVGAYAKNNGAVVIQITVRQFVATK